MKAIYTILTLVTFQLQFYAQQGILESSDLPIFIITTNGLDSIPNEPKIGAHLGIIYNGENERNNLADPFTAYDGNIAIEIRGNGSVARDKVSYAFETQKENGENNNVSLLGFPKENDWVLYAPETDKSFMRNVLAYELAREMGYYATRTKYCEVIVNDEYLGIFVFMEKIKRDKDRIDITSFGEANIDQPAEGGYIIRIDSWWHKSLGWEAQAFIYDGEEVNILYQYVYPKPDEITDLQADYIKNHIDDFELAMFEASPNELHEAYLPYIDAVNFADYFIINELSKNPDGYRLSTFMHKDANSVNDKLKLGPIWDYNFGFGNYCCDYHTKPFDWEFDNDYWDFPSQIPFWVEKLMASPHFVQLINQRWEKWRGELISCERFGQKVDQWASIVDEAKERNFTKWPILGTNVIWDWNAGDQYEDETQLLKNWICERIDWIDLNLPKLQKQVNQNGTIIYPNPSSASFTLKHFSQEGQSKNISIFNASGALISSQYTELTAGENVISFQNLNLAIGLYFVKIEGLEVIKLVIH